MGVCGSLFRCNETAELHPLKPQPEELSIQTNVSYIKAREVSRVSSQVIFHKPQQVTVRCEVLNQAGDDGRNIKLVHSSRCLGECFFFLFLQDTLMSVFQYTCLPLCFIMRLYPKVFLYNKQILIFKDTSPYINNYCLHQEIFFFHTFFFFFVSAWFSQVAVLAAVLALVVIFMLSIIILIAVWRKV